MVHHSLDICSSLLQHILVFVVESCGQDLVVEESPWRFLCVELVLEHRWAIDLLGVLQTLDSIIADFHHLVDIMEFELDQIRLVGIHVL